MKLNSVLVITGGALLSLTIVLIGMFVVGDPLRTCREGYSLVEDPAVCKENSRIITEGFPDCFDKEDLLLRRLGGLKHTECNQDEINLWEDAYWTLVTPIPLCDLEGQKYLAPGVSVPKRVVDVGGARFWLDSQSFPKADHDGYHCLYDARIRIDGSLNEVISFVFAFEDFGGPRGPDGRYDVTLLVPQDDRGVAGLVYDRETGELTYFSTKWNL